MVQMSYVEGQWHQSVYCIEIYIIIGLRDQKGTTSWNLVIIKPQEGYRNCNMGVKMTIISLFAGQFPKYAEQGCAGHRLRHHRLRHCRRQHHGHGLLQDGQTAPDNLKLLSLQVIIKLHHWMKLISVDILQPSNSRLHHRRLFNPLLHNDPRHRKPKMAPKVFFSWF